MILVLKVTGSPGFKEEMIPSICRKGLTDSCSMIVGLRLGLILVFFMVHLLGLIIVL